MSKRVDGSYENFKKALDGLNPDPTTHYNKKSSEENDEIKTEKVTLAEEAIQVLIDGCKIACQKGAYKLEEARTIMNAIDFLNSYK